MKILPSTEITHRYQFAELCLKHQLYWNAMEIGVHLAAFSTRFLDIWNKGILICVDPWQAYEDDFVLKDRSCDFAIAMAALARYNEHVRVLRLTSEEALKYVRHNLQFIYIDADHSEVAVRKDIEIWWPKVSVGGIFAGHDFDLPGVQAAVTDFAEKNHCDVYLTHEPRYMSWYCYK